MIVITIVITITEYEKTSRENTIKRIEKKERELNNCFIVTPC